MELMGADQGEGSGDGQREVERPPGRQSRQTDGAKGREADESEKVHREQGGKSRAEREGREPTDEAPGELPSHWLQLSPKPGVQRPSGLGRSSTAKRRGEVEEEGPLSAGDKAAQQQLMAKR